MPSVPLAMLRTPRSAAPLPAARPRPGMPRDDGLTVPQRRLMIGVILALHALAVWALLQVREVREAVAQAAPLFVSLVAPEKPPEPRVEPPPERPPEPSRPQPKKPPTRVVVATPTQTPSPAQNFAVPPPDDTPPPPPQAAPAVVAEAPLPPLVQPKVIPASAVQYLEPIALEYPRVSRRLGEAGRVLVRVYIDEDGLPKNVQVNRSSGHPRLDDAALAAVQKARFKPYSENGRAVSGWAFIPLEFELEK